MSPLEIIRRYSPMQAHADAGIDAFRFSLRQDLFLHTRFKQAMLQIAELHAYSQHNRVGGGLLLTGPSGVGKSTILQQYLQNFPRQEDKSITKIPVLHVSIPSSPTVKNMAETILIALHDPLARRGSAEEKTFRIYQLLKSCQVELLLMDEFQHCYYSHTIVEFRRVADWLKNMISISGVAVVLCGLEEAEMVVSSNEQLARRFSARLHIPAFRFENQEDFQEFRALLKGYQQSLVIPPEEPLFEANLARRFLVASHGLIDYVRKILEGATVVAGRAGLTKLDLATYAAGFRMNIWPEVQDRLNPFHLESPLRKLDRPGEPYHLCGKHHAIGSPLARRSISKPVRQGD